MNEMDALDRAIGEYVQAGWDVHQATLTGVQLKHAATGRSVYLTAEMATRGERPGLSIRVPVARPVSPWAAFWGGFFEGGGVRPVLALGALLLLTLLCVYAVAN